LFAAVVLAALSGLAFFAVVSGVERLFRRLEPGGG
jgi:hypothetical protein